MAIEHADIPLVGMAMHLLGMGQSVERVEVALQSNRDFGRVSAARARGAIALALEQLRTTELATTVGAHKPLGESQRNVVPTDEVVSVRVVVDYLDIAGGPASSSIIIDAPYGASPNEITDYALAVWQKAQGFGHDSVPAGANAQPIAHIVAVYSYRLGSGMPLGS